MRLLEESIFAPLHSSMSLRLAPQLVCNRLLKEDWEDREYAIHLKKIQEIKNRKPFAATKTSDLKFPHLATNVKRTMQQESGQQSAFDDLHPSEQRASRFKANPSNLRKEFQNEKYERFNNRELARRNREKSIEQENQQMYKKIVGVKGLYGLAKLAKEYNSTRAVVRLKVNTYYTPRGLGYRRSTAMGNLPKLSNKKNKPAIVILHEAANQTERADVALQKTLASMEYDERMETKRKYEERYEADLKKALIKVMEKQFEPLIQALLNDIDLVEVDKIYESLYDPNEAATVITEAFIIRRLEQRRALLDIYHQKMDVELSDEIASKIESAELKTFLQTFLENENLDDEKLDTDKLKREMKEFDENIHAGQDEQDAALDKSFSIFLEAIKTDGRRQLRKLFHEYKKLSGGVEIWAQMDNNRPVVKAVKLIQSYLANSDAYLADKMQRCLKLQNKAEFLRLIATYSQKKLNHVIERYQQKYQANVDQEVKDAFPPDVSRLVIKLMHRDHVTS